MADLREQLQQLLQGRVCLMGLGNVLYGDDGFGVRLAEALKSEGRDPKAEDRSEDMDGSYSDFGLQSHVIIVGTSPERFISRVADEGFDHLIFLDAAEFGATPGSVVLLNSDEMAARFPQVSTHKLSLGLLAKQVEANGKTKAWLLGVQPKSLKPGEELTLMVEATLLLLLELLRDISLVGRAVLCAPRTCRMPDISNLPACRGLRPLPEIPGLEVMA
jgi:hydrogenase maturation protease